VRLAASTVLREDWLAAVRAGLGRFAAFELASPGPRLPGSPSELRALARLKARRGLAYSVHAPFRELDIASADPELQARTERLYAAALEAAGAVEAEVVVMHPAMVSLAGWAALGGAARRALRRREADAFARLARRAARLGMRVAVENMPAFRAARTASWQLGVAAAVGSRWLGCAADVGHAHTAGLPARLLFEALGGKLWHVHVHDNSGWGDQHRAVGEGSVDWRSVAETLVERDYRGLVVNESLDLAAQVRGSARLSRLAEQAARLGRPRRPIAAGRGAASSPPPAPRTAP